MKLNFKVDKGFDVGIKRLEKLLGYECGEGITVYAEAGDKIGVTLSGGVATIYYRDKVQFFRGLGVLIENVKKSCQFEIFEDGHFTTLSAMIDASRCLVPKVESVFSVLDYMALMGYNMMMLYTEDMIELEGRPYFGYMRGRYSMDELHAIDDYAYEYGIEAIACVECYGHMEKYLIWPEARKIKDNDRVMLAREEETFKFVDQLISTASKAFRSRRIHIGMDEAWNMGRGAFLTKNGYVPPFDIFNEYMERLIGITNKYGMKPMMWSDMYFRVQNEKGAYYEESTEIPESTKKLIPKEVELVFWHYGEKPWCDDYMLKKHNELGRKVIYAGGNWGWTGHFPENNYMMSTTKFSLDACRNNGVKEAMLTIWGNDNNECDTYANLFGLSYFAENCYDKSPSKDKLKARFEATTGGDYELFYKMSYYHSDFENGDDYPNFNARFFGKHLFWQDVLAGLHDKNLFEKPMSEHYAMAAEIYRGREGDGRFGYLYEFAFRTLDYLATKTYIAERLQPAYKARDRELLLELKEKHLPLLKEKCMAIHKTHKAAWFKNNKVMGWQNLDIRYAGVVARCDTAIEQIGDYLDGKISKIEELDEERLNKWLSGFVQYSDIATVNIKI